MSHSNIDHLSAPRWLWWSAMGSGLLTVVCGGAGILIYEHHHGNDYGVIQNLLGALYHALQMLILHTPHFHHRPNGLLEAGRWLGALTLVLATGTLLWKRLCFEFRLFRLARWKDHHVVCGLGGKGMAVVHSLKKRIPGARVVAIDPHPDDGLAHDCEALGVILIREDAANPEVLKKARVGQAAEVIVISPEDERNMGIASLVRSSSRERESGSVECFVHLSNIHLRERLQLLADRKPGKRPSCRLNFFDVFDDEARRLLAAFPLDGQGIAEASPASVHVVILGFGRMGRSLALRAAKMGHFANRKPIRISVIDRDAHRKQGQFLFRYPALAEAALADHALCRLDFLQTDAESLTARKQVEAWAAESDTLLHLFVCVSEDTGAIELGLRYQEALARHPGHNLQVRIKTHTTSTNILENPSQPGPTLNMFGRVEDDLCENAYRREYKLDYAMAAHSDFVARRNAETGRDDHQDPALNDWDHLQEDLRESNRQQADHADIKMRAIGCEIVDSSDPREKVTRFTEKEIELLAEIEHSRWNAERFLSGWQFGTPSDKARRINQNLLPWEKLPEPVRKFDCEAVTNIPSILARMAQPMKVVRRPLT